MVTSHLPAARRRSHAAQIQRSDARLNHSVCQSAQSEVSRAARPTPGEHAFASFHIQSRHCKRARWFQCIVKRPYRYNFDLSEKQFTRWQKKYEVWTSTRHSVVCGGRMIYLCLTKSEECMKGESFTELYVEIKCSLHSLRNFICAHEIFCSVILIVIH